jgi:hypothetical protein
MIQTSFYPEWSWQRPRMTHDASRNAKDSGGPARTDAASSRMHDAVDLEDPRLSAHAMLLQRCRELVSDESVERLA